jgi:hypothetical protein
MLQPKKIMVKVKKKIPAERVRAVADSLEDVGKEKLHKSGVSTYDRDVEMRKSGGKDMDNAERYRALADKAEKKSK